MTSNLEKICLASLCLISWPIELLNAHLELVLASFPEQNDYKSHFLVYWFNNQITFNSTNANPMSALIALLNKPDSEKCNLKPRIDCHMFLLTSIKQILTFMMSKFIVQFCKVMRYC